jgi:hypothetical protein
MPVTTITIRHEYETGAVEETFNLVNCQYEIETEVGRYTPPASFVSIPYATGYYSIKFKGIGFYGERQKEEGECQQKQLTASSELPSKSPPLKPLK